MNGPGILNVSGNNTYTGPNTVSAGILNLTGTVPSTANTTVGTTAADAVLNISGSLTVTNYLVIGNLSGAVGAVYQTGGSVTANAASGYDNLILGNVPGAYGYYDALAGTVTANGVCLAGEGNNGGSSSFGVSGNGIMEISSGATVNDTGWFVMARNNNSTVGSEIGVLNVYGGLLTYTGGGLVGPWDTGESAIINVLGGTVSNTSAVGVYLGNTGYTGILNLNGGLLQASVVTGYNGPSYTPVTGGQINFNGGTLQPSAANANFVAVSGADIYGGGATINNNGVAITVAQPLLAPAGNGVVAPTISNPGSGYVAPPIVTVVTNTGDTTGVGATAIAQINVTNGTITNIVITCPGVNYTAAPIFALSGGGGSGAVITGNPNTANVSGGLTSTGAGSLTLTGVSTYGGNTTISNGTLFLSGTGSIANSPIINVGAGAIFDVSAVTGGFTLGASQTLEGSGTVNGTVTVDGTVAPGDAIGTITFNNSPVLDGTLQMRVNRTNAQTADKLVVLGVLTNGGTLTVNNTGDPLQAGDSFTLFSATSYSGSFAVTNLPSLAPGLVWNTSQLAVNGTITVGAIPVITSGPTNVTLECPGSITYNVSATGSGILSYSWTTNSVVAGTGTSLTLNNLHVQAPIAVSVTVSSIYGSATSNATVTVVDTTAPVITVLGANPATNYATVPFTDPGATALDACAGAVGVATNNPVNVNSPGTYTITYTATDGFNNATNTRTVVVLALVQPVITSQQLVGAAFQVTFTGPSNEPYDVLTSTDAGTALTNWTSVASGSFAAGPVTYTNTMPTNTAQFYIIRAP
jgi:autotransporter-associated beta strand protein